MRSCGVGADAVGADDVEPAVALELLSCGRIEDRNLHPRPPVKPHKVGEIARLLKRRRHGGRVRVFVVLLVPLLAVVAEGLVTAVVEVRNADRPTDGEAVVVLVIRGRLVAGVRRVMKGR